MEHTDEKLVKQYLLGNEEAFEALVEKYLKPLFNFSYQMTKDKGAAEDIVQNVFVKVWKNLSLFDERKKFSTWIFAIAKNATFDWIKKKKTISFSELENEKGNNFLEFIEDENALHSEEFLRSIDSKKEIEKLLSSLNPQTKTILLLHHIYGFSLVEISEIMEKSSNTTKSKYHRAILSLRNQLSFE